MSEGRMAVFMIVGGLFGMVVAPMLFMDIVKAEQHAGNEPVQPPAEVNLLYRAGSGLPPAGCSSLV